MARITLALLTTTIIGFSVASAEAQEIRFPMFKTADEEIAAATAKAERALKECDGEAFEDALDWLDDIAGEVSASKEDMIDDKMDDLEDAWDRACGKKLKLSLKPYQMAFIADYGRLNLRTAPAYLGLDDGVAVSTVSLAKPKSSGDYYNLGTEIRLNLTRAPNWPNWPNTPNTPNTSRKFPSVWDMFLGLHRSRADFNSRLGTIDPGADNLLLPGTGSGVNGAGFNVGNFPATGVFYDADYTGWRSYIGSGRTLNRNGVKLRNYGGLELSHLNTNQRFAGAVPGVAVDFAYDTDVDNYAVAPFIGIEAGYRPSWSKASLPFEFYSNARAKVDYNFADGSDSLTVTGFGTQTMDIDKHGFTHDLRLEAGIRFNPDGPYSLSLGGGYQRAGNLPVVTRDGVGPSDLSFKEGDAWTVGLGFQMQF